MVSSIASPLSILPNPPSKPVPDKLVSALSKNLQTAFNATYGKKVGQKGYNAAFNTNKNDKIDVGDRLNLQQLLHVLKLAQRQLAKNPSSTNELQAEPLSIYPEDIPNNPAFANQLLNVADRLSKISGSGKGQIAYEIGILKRAAARFHATGVGVAIDNREPPSPTLIKPVEPPAIYTSETVAQISPSVGVNDGVITYAGTFTTILPATFQYQGINILV